MYNNNGYNNEEILLIQSNCFIQFVPWSKMILSISHCYSSKSKISINKPKSFLLLLCVFSKPFLIMTVSMATINKGFPNSITRHHKNESHQRSCMDSGFRNQVPFVLLQLINATVTSSGTVRETGLKFKLS
jgi:hypothetical protein